MNNISIRSIIALVLIFGAFSCKKDNNNTPQIPLIKTIEPASGIVGTVITVLGDNFDGSVASVKLQSPNNSISVLPYEVGGGKFRFKIPEMLPGDYGLWFTIDGRTTTEDRKITVIPAYTVTGISTSKANAGDELEVSGNGFYGSHTIEFKSGDVVKTATATPVDNNKLKVTIPADLPSGVYTVSVVYGQYKQGDFEIKITGAGALTPVVSSISNVSGFAGDVITITGSNFSNKWVQNLVYLLINNVEQKVETVEGDDKTIKFKVPYLNNGKDNTPAKIIVKVFDFVNATISDSHSAFTVRKPAYVKSVSKTELQPDDEIEVFIANINLLTETTNDRKIEFTAVSDGKKFEATSPVISSTSFKVTVPAVGTDDYKIVITVFNSALQKNEIVETEIIKVTSTLPLIESVFPAQTKPGYIIEIIGHNFSTVSNSVFFSTGVKDFKATVLSANSNSILLETPAVDFGSYDIFIKTVEGKENKIPYSIKVTNKPYIVKINPAENVKEKDQIIITGFNFMVSDKIIFSDGSTTMEGQIISTTEGEIKVTVPEADSRNTKWNKVNLVTSTDDASNYVDISILK